MTSSSDGSKLLAKKKRKDTPPETNMDTQNDGLEKVAPFKSGHFLVSMIIYVKFMGGIINEHSTDSPDESSTNSAVIIICRCMRSVVCNSQGLFELRLNCPTCNAMPSYFFWTQKQSLIFQLIKIIETNNGNLLWVPAKTGEEVDNLQEVNLYLTLVLGDFLDKSVPRIKPPTGRKSLEKCEFPSKCHFELKQI